MGRGVREGGRAGVGKGGQEGGRGGAGGREGGREVLTQFSLPPSAVQFLSVQ